jgi:hypothetical protein
MRDPVSLRNIPPASRHLAQTLSTQTGLSVSDVFRLALISGLLVEAAKVSPDQMGRLAGMEASDLARALRRQLCSAIDLLIEHRQHPYQPMISQRHDTAMPLPFQQTDMAPPPISSEVAMFDQALEDDLEMLGMGQGISAGTE